MKNTPSATIVQRVRNYCNILHEAGMYYGDYVEQRLYLAREVETLVEKSLLRAERLKQALLLSAFEGRL